MGILIRRFNEEIQSGRGIFKFINGDSYEGDFKNGLFMVSTGVFSNGDKYVGQYEDDVLMEKEPRYLIMETNILVILNLVQNGQEFNIC